MSYLNQTSTLKSCCTELHIINFFEDAKENDEIVTHTAKVLTGRAIFFRPFRVQTNKRS